MGKTKRNDSTNGCCSRMICCGPQVQTNKPAFRPPWWSQAFAQPIPNGPQSPNRGGSFVKMPLILGIFRLIRMLIVIVVIFFCCWTPSYIWWLLLTAQDTFKVNLTKFSNLKLYLQGFNLWNSELNTMITILTYLSSCTNPITYCFLNSKFRKALLLTFGCRECVLKTTD